MELLAAAGLGLCLAASLAQTDGPARSSGSSLSARHQPRAASFDYEMPGLPVPHWSIEIKPDGSGRYKDLSAPREGFPTAMPVRVGEATLQRLEAGYTRVSAGICDSGRKHLANTGTKKIAYAGESDQWVSCTFNYSEDKGLMDAAAAFEAIAQTLEDGAQLEHSHRFDRLGLDAEIDNLTRQMGAGQAIEIQNIAPVLQGIVQDERVMDRVRRKSGRLLQDAGLGLGSDRPPLISGTASDDGPNPR